MMFAVAGRSGNGSGLHTCNAGRRGVCAHIRITFAAMRYLHFFVIQAVCTNSLYPSCSATRNKNWLISMNSMLSCYSNNCHATQYSAWRTYPKKLHILDIHIQNMAMSQHIGAYIPGYGRPPHPPPATSPHRATPYSIFRQCYFSGGSLMAE